MTPSSQKRPWRADGFTLLEVMVALAILALSLTVISQAQTMAARTVGRSKHVTIATMLARQLMVETEDKLFEEGFSDFDEEKKDNFRELGFKQYSYTLKVDKVELPPNINADSLAKAASGGGDDSSGTGSGSGAGPGGGGGGMFAAGAKLMGAQFELFRNVLEQSIRRVTVRVAWKEGSKKRFIQVVGYFTDPRKIDAVAGGARVTPGTSSTTSSTSSGTPKTPTLPGTKAPAVPR